jgi:hypothetical protein
MSPGLVGRNILRPFRGKRTIRFTGAVEADDTAWGILGVLYRGKAGGEEDFLEIVVLRKADCDGMMLASIKF